MLIFWEKTMSGAWHLVRSDVAPRKVKKGEFPARTTPIVLPPEHEALTLDKLADLYPRSGG